MGFWKSDFLEEVGLPYIESLLAERGFVAFGGGDILKR